MAKKVIVGLDGDAPIDDAGNALGGDTDVGLNDATNANDGIAALVRGHFASHVQLLKCPSR